MLGNYRSVDAEEFADGFLSQPYVIVLHPYLKTFVTRITGEDKEIYRAVAYLNSFFRIVTPLCLQLIICLYRYICNDSLSIFSKSYYSINLS